VTAWTNLHERFPALAVLEAHAADILTEADAIAEDDYQIIPVNESRRCRWMVFRLVLGPDAARFPHLDPAEGRRRCPRTLAVLDTLPGVQRAAFARISEGATLESHTDPRDDDMVRLHLGLRLPPGEHRWWRPGTARVLDVREPHGAVNPGPGPRITLLVDQRVAFVVPNGAIPAWRPPDAEPLP
jgi:beta-hydroxylase